MNRYRCGRFLTLMAEHESRVANYADKTTDRENTFAALTAIGDLGRAKTTKARALAAHLRACPLCR